ncbi:M56 family metallopeptidase [Amycolatopsis taiwanensis]|uniref:M56 family metallopeptidase n=1 Tax=Amycolatopsis taiwanensis TaxID=342230 RepID=UPI0004871233|nr:M56 family metallopeptidase [Amycolatopsis taiwanensis]
MNRPLVALVVAAVATYPALGLGWCVAMLLTFDPDAWASGVAGHPGVLASIGLVVIGASAIVNAIRTAVSGLRQTRRFHAWVAAREAPLPAPLAELWHEFGPRYRIRLVNTQEQVVVTTGLLRPTVVLSVGLVETLSRAELRAVLAHEHSHARRRDPLLVLLGSVLAAHLWFLPVARDLRSRAAREHELAADRHAATRCGRQALAGALLRVITQPTPAHGAAAPFAGADLLDARITQLESGRPPRPTPVPRLRSALTAAGALAFTAAVAGTWLLMLTNCPAM